MEIRVIKDVMEDNDRFAARVRDHLRSHRIAAVNLMSAPGSGKTALLEWTLKRLTGRVRAGVIEGDVQTSRDAERIARHNVPVVQINTEGECHLEARLVLDAVEDFPLDRIDLLFIENVGNLVCPVEFDLGQHARVALVSAPEGADKPAKYPQLFRAVDAILLTKTDLLPYVDFDLNVFRKDVAGLNPEAERIELSCRTGEGCDRWLHWLDRLVERVRGEPAALA